MRKTSTLNKLLSILLCVAMLATNLPAITLTASGANSGLHIVEDSKTADPSTLNGWTQYFGSGKMDTEFAGAVWTDKSVFTENTNELPGVSLTDSKNFLVALSAIASNLSITGHTSAPTDTMLVLDLSGSMVDGTTSVGYVRRNNNYQQVTAIDMSLINAMVEATNATIKKLMEQNTNNRVGVVLYSGNTSTNQNATASTATVVLPLGRYTGINGEYLTVDADTTTSQLYIRQGNRWVSAGTSDPYVPVGEEVHVSVKAGLKTEAGANVSSTSKEVVGGTYIQNGLYKAMSEFIDVQDTTVPAGRPQEGAERLPVIVLMSDGAPTIATTNYTNIQNSNTGNGGSTNDKITMLTQLTAAYVRGRVAAHYKENDQDEEDVLFLTLGLGTENSSAATNTLYPAGSGNTLQSAWEKYLAAASNRSVEVLSGSNEMTVTRSAYVKAMNYVDKYFYASNAQGLLDSFNDIMDEISIKAESFATLVEGSSADFSGYVTFDDELGEMMQVYKVGGILVGNRLFTGEEIAKGMTDGNLGTIAGPTEKGDELVRTVRERIPGTTTTQAQQLINNAYLDHQLYYDKDTNQWSNYIGWYADAEGNYVGFWDKDSGYENAPAGAVYANRSYGYLGENDDSDMMHIVVMVRTELATLHQTVLFKIPAALLPTVQYRVTLSEDNASQVESFVREGAEPMRLVFEVGVREDINSVNLEQKIQEHLDKSTANHIHRDKDTGIVTFYTNEWKIGNDANGNGIPDPEEVDDAKVAQAHFHPALDNTRFYYTEDTVILTGNGREVTGSTRPSDTDSNTANGTGYFYNRYIYSNSGRTTVQTPIAATTLANDAQYADGRWYIPAGTMYHNLARFETDKTSNLTDTLDYSFFPAVFDGVSKQDVYMFLGNNGSIQVAPATGFVLSKQVQGTIPGVTQYTFRVTLSDTNAVPVLTDANGDAISNVTMSAVSNGQFTVTMPANVKAYISGIPVGTVVTVEELINGDYKIVGIDVAGQAQTGSASFTIPPYSATGDQMVSVSFTNAPNGYGDLVITKDVTHPLASDPEALATKVFTFKVTLTGSKINATSKFSTSAGKDVIVANDGTVTFVDGTSITLRNEESITIYRLPEGTGYTVVETEIPEGFALASKTADEGIIAANRTNAAAFVNRYLDEFVPVEIPLNVTVNKDLNDLSNAYNANEDFVFVLQRLLADNTYPSIADDNGNKYLKVSADSSETSTWTLKFENMGTYYYRIVELKPSEQTPAGTDTAGMTYSTTRALFAIIVTDNDMDGKLELTVRQEANLDGISATYGDPQDHETATKVDVEATFENTYQVHSTNVAVNVHKKLDNETGVDIPLTSFRFGLYAVDAGGNATGDPISTVTASQLGDATFNILITEDQDLQYIIKEIVPATKKVGMTYDPAEYILNIVVEVDPETSDLIATPTLTLKGGDGSSVEKADFKNIYELTGTAVNIPISKTFTGRALKSGESFQAYLERTDSTFAALTGSDAWNATYTLPVNSGSNNVTLRFEKAGTYHYRFTEVIPEGGNTKGMTYDTAEYRITVTVTDNGQGALTAQTVIHKVGAAEAVSTVAFTNTYTVTGEGQVTIGGKKNLPGRNLVAGEFTIGLYSDEACEDEIETTKNNADGSFSFSTIYYTTADLGEDNATKTYTYYVKEINDGKGGVAYDGNTYTVTVTVDHKDGVLTVTPSDNATKLQINNSYTAKEVPAVIRGNKVLSGDWSKVSTANKTFTFELYEANASFERTNQEPIKTTTVTGSGNFSMSLTYKDGEEGFYYYVLKEDTTEGRGGVSYDAGEYHITVTVSDPGDGQLVATVTMYRPGTGNTNSATFTNTYTVEPIAVTLDGSKAFVDTTTNLPVTMREGDFSFLVLDEQENVAATGYNKADGTIQFSEITYTAAGVYEYTVVEDPGEAGGVAYDDTTFTVIVTVTDNGDGTLSAEVNDGAEGVTFENKYTPGAAEVILEGIKTLENKTLGADKFTFWLYETDSTFATEGLTPVEKGHAADGTISLGTLTFDKTGTYYYRLVEKNGGQTIDGIQYSEAFYNITIVVTDNGAGKLIPAVTVSDTNATVAVNDNVATVSGLNFTNTYTAQPVTYVPAAKKDYKGDAMKEFTFVLSGEGFVEQKKQNDGDGMVEFDTLTFDRADTYEFTIREQENILWGFIRWDVNVYKLTIKVVDDGVGQLKIESVTITSELGTDDLVFHNVHEDLITDKDVFLYTEPTVSIDGKKVQIGDELLYKISYTNYTGKTASQVTITDTLPASLTYVDGSADKGGSNANGVITWQLTNVAAEETVTVSFRAKVNADKTTIANTATVVDDENTYTTNEVTNPVTNDEVIKTVAKADAPIVSIDGQKVAVGDVLLYTITYTNGDDQAARVTITDTLSQYVTYVADSADNAGVYANGAIAWTLELAGGESRTVSFKVTVKNTGATIENQAQAFDGVNRLDTNTVKNYTPAPPSTPVTGDDMNLGLWLSMLLVSAAGMMVLIISRRRILK